MKTITNIIYSAIALACFALLPTAQAVVPAPDGGYPGGNTAEGQKALLSLSTGGYNTAVGFLSLLSDTTGTFNTALGAGALLLNTADNNTATGTVALLSNTTGAFNTANGAFALFNNTTGNYNTAIGYHALYSNVSDLGSYNDAFGEFALQANTTGNSNLGIGGAALISNTTGGINTAIGLSALYNSTTAFYNIALGYCAGQNQTTGNNNIYLSGPGVAGESDAIRIGNVVPFTDVHGGMHAAHTATFIAGINGTAVVGSNVVIDANGQLGTATSSARFKKNIKPMENASDAILTLKPVTFEYNSDAKGTPQFGLIAEDVAKVNSDLVVRDRNGEIYSVRYDAVNAMLLNEFLKEHRTVQALTSTVAKQEAIIAKQQKDFQATVAQQQKQIDGLAAGLQKVSAQLEASRPAPQVVNNP
jgi:Chaperone of endosialidase